MSPFEKAFAAARKAGKKTFEFKGKSFHTELAESAPKDRPKAEARPKARPSSEARPKARPFTEAKPKATPKSDAKQPDRPVSRTPGIRRDFKMTGDGVGSKIVDFVTKKPKQRRAAFAGVLKDSIFPTATTNKNQTTRTKGSLNK